MTDTTINEGRRKLLTGMAATGALGAFGRLSGLGESNHGGTRENDWAGYINRRMNEPACVRISSLLADNPSVAKQLNSAMQALKISDMDKFGALIESDTRPIAHHLLVMMLSHKHLKEGNTLEKLPGALKDYMTSLAGSMGMEIPHTEIPSTPEHPTMPLYRCMYDSNCGDKGDYSSLLMFVGDATVVGLSTHPAFAKNNSKHADSVRFHMPQPAGMIHAGGGRSHVDRNDLIDNAQRHFLCGIQVDGNSGVTR